MEIFAKLILTIAGNLTALVITAYIDSDFLIATDAPSLLSLVFALAVLNLTLRPLLRLIFSPLIGITLGLFNIVISAGILYGIDIYSNSLTINGLWALILGAHLVGLITTIIDYASTMVYGSGEIQ